MKNIIILLIVITSFNSWAQHNTNYADKFNINLNIGTSVFYSSAALNFESPNFLKSEKHRLKLSVGFARWQFSLLDSNDGILFNTKLVYLVGTNAHHFEVDLGANYQFDIKQNESKYSYLSTVPNAFIGYRYQKPSKHFMFKAGLGMIDFIQIGFGYSF